MRRFQFSLETVLTLRNKTLEDERIKLASIINILNKQKDVLNEMIQTLNNYQNFNDFDNYNHVVISNTHAFCKKLSFDIKTQNAIIERTKLDLAHQQEIVKEAYIKVKSLENLKEKQKQQYSEELLQEEIKQMDDIVNSRRIRT